MRAASTASRSTRSFITSPEWPTHAPSVNTVVVTTAILAKTATLSPHPWAEREHGCHGTGDLRRLRPPAARHRSRRDQRVARLLRRRRREPREEPGPVPAD